MKISQKFPETFPNCYKSIFVWAFHSLWNNCKFALNCSEANKPPFIFERCYMKVDREKELKIWVLLCLDLWKHKMWFNFINDRGIILFSCGEIIKIVFVSSVVCTDLFIFIVFSTSWYCSYKKEVFFKTFERFLVLTILSNGWVTFTRRHWNKYINIIPWISVWNSDK